MGESSSTEKTAQPAWLTASAMATRSLREVERIKDTEARRQAFSEHMRRFPPLIGSY